MSIKLHNTYLRDIQNNKSIKKKLTIEFLFLRFKIKYFDVSKLC